MTDVADNFNRANGALGSNWVVSPAIAGAGPSINSNQLIGFGSGDQRLAFWNPAVNTFANDQFAQATCVTNTGFTGLALRQNAAGNGYFAWAAAAGAHYIYRLDAGIFVLLATNTGPDDGANRIAHFEVAGSALTLKINGNVVLTATDSTYASGQPGILSYTSSDIMDDWLGGPIIATSVTLTAAAGSYTQTGADAPFALHLIAEGAT